MNSTHDNSTDHIVQTPLAVREMFERVINVAQLLKNHSYSQMNPVKKTQSGDTKTQDYEAVVS